MSRILRFSFLMLLLAAFHLGAYAQEQTEAKTAKVKLTKSEKKELNDSIRARARQRALEKEVDRRKFQYLRRMWFIYSASEPISMTQPFISLTSFQCITSRFRKKRISCHIARSSACSCVSILRDNLDSHTKQLPSSLLTKEKKSPKITIS